MGTVMTGIQQMPDNKMNTPRLTPDTNDRGQTETEATYMTI